MRFCDFFIEYKIGLKSIKNSIPWTKLPLYRKIYIIITYVIGVLSILFTLLKFYLALFISIGVILLLLITFIAIDASKNNLREMLDKHYSIHSQNRMIMLKNIFKKYQLNMNDTDVIDLLITQAERAKIENNPFLSLKKPLKALGTIIIPIVIYIARDIAETSSTNELIYWALLSITILFCLISIIYSLTPLVISIFYSDYNRYDELIYDLNQLKIFYKEL